MSVDSTANSVTVTATLQDTNATMTINRQVTSSGQRRSISLDAPGTSTDIDILVIAPNASSKIYSITINREGNGDDNTNGGNRGNGNKGGNGNNGNGEDG